MKMTTEDILGYLTMTDASEHQKIVSQLDENVAYELYEKNTYTNLGSFMHYYMFEVLVSNMKYHHFNGGVEHAMVHYKIADADAESVKVGDRLTGTELIPITSKKDMRTLGEERFKDFILTYGTSMFRGVVHEKRDLYSVVNQHHLDNLIYFLTYAIHENMGMLTMKGYEDIKEGLKQRLVASYEDESASKRERYLKRWGTLSLAVENSFRLAEAQYFGKQKPEKDRNLS